MRTVIALMIALIGCRGSRQSQPTAERDGPAPVMDAAPTINVSTDAAPTIDATHAIDAATPTPISSDAVASAFARDAGTEPVVLAERGGAIVATTPSGQHEQVIAKGPTRRAMYDSLTWTIWFLRDGRLTAIDLTRPEIAEVVVVESMPDIEYRIDNGPLEDEWCPAGCVAIRSGPSPALAVIDATGEAQATPTRAELAAIERARTTAPPRITDVGRAFLADVARRRRIVWPAARPTHVPLSDTRGPLPPSARCTQTCQADDCGHSFEIDAFARSLMVVGRKCNRSASQCWGLCVWFDPQHRRYAPMRAPGRWRADVTGEPACTPHFDASGTAYAIGDWISPGPLSVCTANACRVESGHYLGWLVDGFSTDGVCENQVKSAE